MAIVETSNSMGLSPQKSLFVLVIIVGCFAVLWPRILGPMFLGPPKDALDPNQFDKTAGCCDVLYDTDINAIKIMTELCGNILRSQKDGIDPKTEQAFQSGKLTKSIVDTCRQEVNKTCGVDITLFLNHNIALGKTFKQILDDVRSYNSSTCLKMNYGVAPWTLGVPHLVGKWVQELDSNRVRQERPANLRHPPIHPALRERGRAIPVPPQSIPHPTVPIAPHSGRPIPMRPPMGASGRVAAPPKTSMGFLMPLYTFCIVIFFFYTIFKLVFRKDIQEPVTQPLKYVPDKQGAQFRKTVFNKTERTTPEPSSKIVVSAISGLVAEVRQQMEEEECNHKTASTPNQDIPIQPYTNGSIPQEQRESSPVLSKAKDFTLLKETTPPSWEATTPVQREETVLVEEFTPKEKESMPAKETLEDESPPAATLNDLKVQEEEVRDVEKIGTKHEEDIVEKLRSGVEKENATVKVLGMEMRAHCEGGKKWTAPRPPTPPINASSSPTPHSAGPAHHIPGRSTPDVEVSSIYLEGALPHQSRLLVADSETHTEKLTNGDEKYTPIVLSGKMTLSLINDTSSKSTPERDYAVRDESTVDDDEDFVTASSATAPKQEEEEEYEEGSEEEEELEEEEVIQNNDTKKPSAAHSDKGDAITTDAKRDVGEEEESEEEEEYEEDEVVEVVEEPKKDTSTNVQSVKSDDIQVEVGDDEEEYEEEVEEEEEIEEPVEEKTESTSVDARRDNPNTISVSSEATSKKVDDEVEYEYDDDEEMEVEMVEEVKTNGDNGADKKIAKDPLSSISSNDASNSISLGSVNKQRPEEDDYEEEYEVEYEEDEEEDEEIDDVIEKGESADSKHSVRDT